MGNITSAFNNYDNYYNYDNYDNYDNLKQDRLIDGENKIYIGIVSQKPHTNPYSSQAIRIGDEGKLHRLEKIIETQNSLIYEYDSKTSMTLSKRHNEIIINVNEPDTNTHIIKPMDSIVREIFKPIHWGNLSNEYEKIHKFIEPKIEDIQTNLERELASGCVISHQPMEK